MIYKINYIFKKLFLDGIGRKDRKDCCIGTGINV